VIVDPGNYVIRNRSDLGNYKIADTYPQVVDSEGTLLGSLRSPGLPVTVVLDAEGRVVGRQIGRINEQRLTDLVTEATR